MSQDYCLHSNWDCQFNADETKPQRTVRIAITNLKNLGLISD